MVCKGRFPLYQALPGWKLREAGGAFNWERRPSGPAILGNKGYQSRVALVSLETSRASTSSNAFGLVQTS
jgi:hypothetical protein